MCQSQGADAGQHERDVAYGLAARVSGDRAGLGQEREPVAEGDDVPAVQIRRMDPAVLALQAQALREQAYWPYQKSLIM
jgi:hypothetical protein